MTSSQASTSAATAAAPSPLGQRLRRGTKTEDYLIALSNSSEDNSSPTPSLAAIDSPFQVQEHLALLVAQDPHNVARLVELPRWRRDAKDKASSSEGSGGSEQHADADEGDDESEEAQTHVERDVWLYEHLRRLANDLSHPFVLTLQEHCSRETCPEMKAGEWLYLCAAHATANETECCAIDYITHTLDGATALLNSSRYFPSRLSIPQTSLKHFTSIARRLYRIFAHAWFHHREVFDICESETSLYERFLSLSQEYELVSPDLLVIPSQKSGSAAGSGEEGRGSGENSSSSESSEDDEEGEVEAVAETEPGQGVEEEVSEAPAEQEGKQEQLQETDEDQNANAAEQEKEQTEKHE